MNISYLKRNRPPYINFRMRKLIYNSIFEKCNDKELAQKIANECEKIVTSNFWVKDMRKEIGTIVSINKKVA